MTDGREESQDGQPRALRPRPKQRARTPRHSRRRRVPALALIIVVGAAAVAGAFFAARALQGGRAHGRYLIGGWTFGDRVSLQRAVDAGALDEVSVDWLQSRADGRQIAVDVYPKTRERGAWDGPRAQDWERLGKAVDQFRVMTYNYSGSWSSPGPLSSPAWMDDVLSFAETRVAPHKVVMGLGFYGRDWRGDTTTDLVWDDVRRIRANHDPKPDRGDSAELRLRYRRGGARHTAYFPDAEAIDAKLTMFLERHARIGGVYAWRMGQEDPAVWALLHRRLY